MSEPNLIEYVVAAGNNPSMLATTGNKKIRQRHGDELRAMVRNSRRFFVDKETTKAAAEIGIRNPNIVMQLLRRARLPASPICWFEWDNHAAIEAGGQPVHPDAAEKVGCFVEQIDKDKPEYRITIIGFLGKKYGNQILISPCSYVFRTDAYPEKNTDTAWISKVAKIDEDFIENAALGYGVQTTYYNDSRETNNGWLKEGNYRSVFDRSFPMNNESTKHCITVLTPITKSQILRDYATNPKNIVDYVKSDIIESAGTCRFIISLLALMNYHDYVSLEQSSRPKQKRIINGKITPYIEHITVRMKIPREIAERNLIKHNSNSLPKRQSDVLGSWRTHRKPGRGKGDIKCDHAYVPESDRNQPPVRSQHEFKGSRMVCVYCDKLVWWTTDYKRGNPEVGIIIKDRKITLGKH